MRTPGTRSQSGQGDPALRYAFKLLSYRGRSGKEIAERLKRKGFDEAAVDRVVAHLLSAGLLDDRKLAASLKRYAGESKCLSVLGTKRFLTERGVPRDLIEETIKDIDEIEVAKRLVEKKLAAWEKHAPGEGPMPKQDMIRRLYGILIRRGYTSEIIKKTLGQFRYKEEVE